MMGDTERLQRIRHEHQTPLDLNGLWWFVYETLTATYVPSRPDRRSISAPVTVLLSLLSYYDVLLLFLQE